MLCSISDVQHQNCSSCAVLILANQRYFYSKIKKNRNVKTKNGFCNLYNYDFDSIAGITYAGNHGLDIVHEDGSTFVHPMPSEYKTKLDKLHEVLKAEVCHDGAWVEDKGTLLCFHFRSEHCKYFLWVKDH